MAILNIEIESQNLVPVNGSYVFTAQFLNATTDQLLVDARFPQNQVYTTSILTNPLYIPLEIADGTYPINNVKLKILYKNKSFVYIINGESVNCSVDCVGTISSIAFVSGTTYTVTMSQSVTNSYNWKLYSSDSVIVGTGTVNLNSSTFNIVTSALPAGKYLFELTGTSCRGTSRSPMEIANSISTCQRGPTIVDIVTVTPTTMHFHFDGVAVYSFTWRIKQGTNVLRTGVMNSVGYGDPSEPTHTDSNINISFAELNPGSYTLEIEGRSCSSVSPSTMAFSVGTPIEPLAFVGASPEVTGGSGNYQMSITINKTAVYKTTILNSTTGTYYRNNIDVSYTKNVPYLTNSLPVGNYVVTVGTLTKQLIIADSGLGSCPRNPTIIEVRTPTPTSLEYLYDADGVTSSKWRIKKDGTTVRNGVVYPTNNHPVLTYAELEIGNYTLEIEGNNCSSPVSSMAFVIAPIVTGDNAGRKITTVGNRTFAVISTKGFGVSINPSNGAVQLIYDELSTAEQGGKQVKAYLLNDYEDEIPEANKTALRAGTQVPDGNYKFILRYAPPSIVSNFSEIRGNMWTIFLNPDTWPSNTKKMEYLSLVVTTNTLI